MKIRQVKLESADGLPPIPMQMSWVRDGVLIVGMDNEMHVYSQWKMPRGCRRDGADTGPRGYSWEWQSVEAGSLVMWKSWYVGDWCVLAIFISLFNWIFGV